jgi:Flp pilus assembly protein TadG
MKRPLFHRAQIRCSERGVTMILVAVCMMAIVAMAALSIDVVTLYLARMEAQRTADAAALAAARVISLSGITGDPNDASGYWAEICGGSTGAATQAALAAAAQTVDRVTPTVTVNYSAGGTTQSTCVGLTSAFAVNPMVTVQVTRTNLPTFFSHMWGNTGNTTSATATAEAFNPSNSGNVGNGGASGVITPVQPRCVKPWMVPNLDPLNPAGCTNNCSHFVDQSDGHIINPGISLSGTNSNGVIGEQFWLASDCIHVGSSCTLRQSPPQANFYRATYVTVSPNLLYLPGQAPTTAPVAVPSSGSGGNWEEATAGCDQSTAYECGVQKGNTIDLSENPQSTNDMIEGVESLTHQGTPGTTIDGQDTINDASYPFQFLAGTSNPLVGASLASGSQITSSNSIVTIPIYDSNNAIASSGTSQVTIVGFLQVFINYIDQYSNVYVTVLNVSGCGTNATGTAVAGSSPVPIRLITQ